jgi:hypothetical protein
LTGEEAKNRPVPAFHFVGEKSPATFRNLLHDIANKNTTFAPAEQNLTIQQMLEGTTPIDTPKHHFKNFDQARQWAKENIVGTYNNKNTGEDIYISIKAVEKYLSQKAVEKSVDKDAHLSALKQMPKLIETAVLREASPDTDNNANIKEIQRLYGAINYEGRRYPVKITVKAYYREGNKAYSYEVMQIESPIDQNLPGQSTSDGNLSYQSSLSYGSKPMADSPQTTSDHPSPKSRQPVAENRSSVFNSKDTNNSQTTKQNPQNPARLQVSQPKAPKFNGDILDFTQRITTWTADRIDNQNEKIGAIQRDKILYDYKKILQELATQKSNFQQSGNAITYFVRNLIDNQTFDEMTRAQMNQIITQIKNATTKIDILNNAKKIFDIVINKQIKTSEKILDKYLNLKVRGTNQSGVAVGKRIDDNARIIVETVHKYRLSPLTDIDERLHELEDLYGEETDNGKQEKITHEQIGLNIAKRYNILVSETKKELQAIAEQINEERKKIEENQDKKTDKNGKVYRVAKTDKGNEIKKSREIIHALEDELRAGKEQLRKGIDWISVEMSGVIETGKQAKKNADNTRIEHKREILKSAFFDLADVYPKTYDKKTGKTYMQKVWDGIKSPLPTFDYELRKLGRRAINGEGNLFNYFAPKIIKAVDEEFNGRQKAIAMLDKKAQELFGKSAEKVMKEISNTDSEITIEAINPFSKEKEKVELTIGNATYIYMANKMADTKINLRAMGITEENVENITPHLPENIIRFADWMQEQFYPNLRKKYTKTYEKQFGIQMPNIENYVPKKILTGAVKIEDDITHENAITLPTILAGSLIARKRNKHPIDIINTDFLNIAFEHIDEMEYWNSFIGITEDLNTLLSSPRFKVKLENISKGETKRFREAAQIAVGAYTPAQNAFYDYTSLLAKTYAKSKIAFRLNTAAKQILSLPAFSTEGTPVIIGYMTKNMANPYGSWKWAMDNLPTFEKRVKSRLAGNEKLDMSEEKISKILKKLNTISDIGMYPNMFVDALTVSVGARSVYEYHRGKYKKMGYPDEVAEEKALINAAISFNETQQSAEGMFLAPIQRNRDLFSNAVTVYNNANMGYQRKVAIAATNIQRYITNRDKMISFRTKQLMNDGFEESKAKKQAQRDIDNSFHKSAAQLIMNGYILQWIWRFGLTGLASALLAGDDDDKKDVANQAKNASIGALITPFRGLVGGSTLEYIIDKQLKGINYGSMMADTHPLLSDTEKTGRKFWTAINKDDYALLVYTVANLAGGLTGTNLDTIGNISAALFDLAATNTDLSPQQITLDLAIIANLPNSQTKEMAEALNNGNHDDFIKEYIKWRNKYGLLYNLRKQKK